MNDDYLFCYPYDDEGTLINFACRSFVRAITYLPETIETTNENVQEIIKIIEELENVANMQHIDLTNDLSLFYTLASSGYAYGYSIGSRVVRDGMLQADKQLLLQGNKEVEDHYFREFIRNWNERHLYTNYKAMIKKPFFHSFYTNIEFDLLKKMEFCTVPFPLTQERMMKFILSEWMV